MELNGIKLFDEPNMALLTPTVKREIINCIDIFKSKKLSIHDHTDLVGNLIGYELLILPADYLCGGYCSYTKNIIAIAADSTQPVYTLFHEIGHAIQNRLGLFNLKETLSYQVKLEHQAETIAYNLYAALVNKNIDHKLFNAYFNIEDIKWLNGYFDGFYENDLF